MLAREIQENFEIENLSPYATLSVKSKGRKRPEDACEIRTCFQRDRDRIIHSKSFRRLKHKTQVFIAPDFDHYRTRLTHTLEVSQIARTISRALKINEDLTEAIALAHDLGHTPFGHKGEEFLDEICKEHNKNFHFKHNEQSLRVVDVLERDGEGLNLTYEVRDGILKHSKGEEDLEEFSEESQETLEGEVVRIADRIAYINHDIDDALRAKIIKEEDIPKNCLQILGSRHSGRIDRMVKDIIHSSQNSPHLKMSKQISIATDDLKNFLYEKVYFNEKLRNQDEKVKGILKSLFKFYLEQESFLKEFGKDRIKKLRAVCDYIAGMTDRFCILEYEKNFLPEGWH